MDGWTSICVLRHSLFQTCASSTSELQKHFSPSCVLIYCNLYCSSSYGLFKDPSLFQLHWDIHTCGFDQLKDSDTVCLRLIWLLFLSFFFFFQEEPQTKQIIRAGGGLTSSLLQERELPRRARLWYCEICCCCLRITSSTPLWFMGQAVR